MPAAKPDPLAHVPKNARAGLAKMNAGKPIAEHGIQPILDRYEAGEPIEEIASSLGIKRQAIYRALVPHPEWPIYQSAAALADLDDARSTFRDKTVTENGVVARVREQAKLAMWTLERTAADIYGNKQQVSVSVGVSIEHSLAEDALDLLSSIRDQKVIEHK